MSYLEKLAQATQSLNVRGTTPKDSKVDLNKQIEALDLSFQKKELPLDEYQQKKGILVRKLTQAV